MRGLFGRRDDDRTRDQGRAVDSSAAPTDRDEHETEPLPDLDPQPSNGESAQQRPAAGATAVSRNDSAGADAFETALETSGEAADDNPTARAQDGARQGEPAKREAGEAEPTEDETSANARAEDNDRVRATISKWADDLAVLGGAAPLLYFSDVPGTYIELTNAHPGGIAALLAGKPTELSNLIRDRASLGQALDAADLVAEKAVELVAGRAMATIHLATGIAEWTLDGLHHRAPVLIRPVSLRKIGRDYEIELRGRTHVNPSLVKALVGQFGVRLDVRELLRLAGEDEAFLPQAVFERVRSDGARIPGFTVAARSLITSFGDTADAMLAGAQLDRVLGADIDPNLNLRGEHETVAPGTRILRALAGDRAAAAAIAKHATTPADRPSPDRRDPATERLLLDADTEQERIIDAISAGNSLAVEALPGTALTQSIVNAIGLLVADGKRVLVVTPRSATIRTIRQRLRSIGLAGLAVNPRTLRHDAIAAISRNERADKPVTADVDDALVRLRHVLVDYRVSLTKPDKELGVSALDALEALADLELADVPPATVVRLSRESVIALANRREEAAGRLREIGALGQFKYGPDDSPWYGVSFKSVEETERATSTAKRLADGELAAIVDRGRELISRTRLRPARTFAELGLYLRLLLDIRETLDRFHPDVFDRSLTDLIQATSEDRNAGEMSGSRRRQLVQVARDYVRPGHRPDDLHESLRQIQRQRILWSRYVEDGSNPTVPTGTDEVRAEQRRIAAALHVVDKPLMEAGASSLADLPFDQLFSTMDALAKDSEVLENLQERLRITEQLDELGLRELVDDLADRHVAPDLAGAELELAWWQSVLEQRLADDKALLNANTRVLTRLEGDFRIVDQAHTAATAKQLAYTLSQSWKIAIVDYPEEASALREMLRRPGMSSTAFATRTGRLGRALTPVWIASPYDVPLIADDIDFDVVIVADAASVTVAETAGAIRRAGQLVAFGDPVIEHPSPFSIGVQREETLALERERADEETIRAWSEDSVFARLSAIAGTRTLTRSYRSGGEDLAELINRRFYDSRIRSMPWAGALLGYSSLSLSYVEQGTGLPDEATGAVESTDAEVTRAVEFVIDHAIHRPNESLMVLTASDRHARRVTQAVYSLAATRGELAAFLTDDDPEPFVVTTIENAQALSRDRVIFSLGYGRTPHGRVLSNFGVLATALGSRSLAIAITRARRSLAVITSVNADQLEAAELGGGIPQLVQVLRDIDGPGAGTRVTRPSAQSDVTGAIGSPLLQDLAQRLRSYGMIVQLGHRERIPLVAAYGGRAIAIDTDGLDANVTAEEEPTLREALRLRPELLKRLGWYYIRVHAFELFADPDAVARRIAVALKVPTATPKHTLSPKGQTRPSDRGAIATATPGGSGVAATTKRSDDGDAE